PAPRQTIAPSQQHGRVNNVDRLPARRYLLPIRPDAAWTSPWRDRGQNVEQRGSALAGPMIYAFADFELDTRRWELRRGGEAAHVETQVYAVLLNHRENRDRLVPKEELLDQVWGHRFVTPATLTSPIKALRRALGDD